MGATGEKYSVRFKRLTGGGKITRNGYLNIGGGIIESTSLDPLSGHTVLDYSENNISPGLIDIHTHGYAGFDSMSKNPEDIHRWSREIVRTGVTGFIPTSVSSGRDGIIEFIRNVKSASEMDDGYGAGILGSRLEGPFISVEKKGAHDPEFIRNPSHGEVDILSGMAEDGLKIVDIAPEIEGAKASISQFLRSGIVVSAGHTNCSFEEAMEAIDRGVPIFTHFFNAMTGLHHRHPGMVGAGLLSGKVQLELICDFKHVVPEVIDIAVEMRGWGSIILVTDSISATNLGDGTYKLGSLDVKVKDGTCFIAGTETLAGSTLTLCGALKNLVNHGHSLQDAIAAATKNPAKILGLTDRGELRPGMRADLCIFDEDMEVAATFVGGRKVYSRDD